MKNQENRKDADGGKRAGPVSAMVVLTLFAGVLFCAAVSHGQDQPPPMSVDAAEAGNDLNAVSGTEQVPDIEKETTAFGYDPSVLPDPFLPLVQETPSRVRDIKTVEITTPTTPLQRYDLNDFNLVAVIISDEPAALLEDPDGFGYTVREGMEIGRYHGVITKISRHGITVDEKYKDAQGNIEFRTQSLTIRKGR